MRRGRGAAAARLNLETLRCYERRGLLAAPDRSPGGHRLYPPETVTVLWVIKAAQPLGITLDEISDLLELGRHATAHPSTPDFSNARTKLVEVEERIADLTPIRYDLTAAIDASCDDPLACASSQCCPSRSRPSLSTSAAFAHRRRTPGRADGRDART
jgi:DNA-binding transcriptional MerR regulator